MWQRHEGCRRASSVWTLSTAKAINKIGKNWCQQASAWFADDTLFQVMFRTVELQTLKAIARALHILKILGVTIPKSKCAVLFEIRGTQYSAITDSRMQP